MWKVSQIKIDVRAADGKYKERKNKIQLNPDLTLLFFCDKTDIMFFQILLYCIHIILCIFLLGSKGREYLSWRFWWQNDIPFGNVFLELIFYFPIVISGAKRNTVQMKKKKKNLFNGTSSLVEKMLIAEKGKFN